MSCYSKPHHFPPGLNNDAIAFHLLSRRYFALSILSTKSRLLSNDDFECGSRVMKADMLIRSHAVSGEMSVHDAYSELPGLPCRPGKDSRVVKFSETQAISYSRPERKKTQYRSIIGRYRPSCDSNDAEENRMLSITPWLENSYD